MMLMVMEGYTPVVLAQERIDFFDVLDKVIVMFLKVLCNVVLLPRNTLERERRKKRVGDDSMKKSIADLPVCCFCCCCYVPDINWIMMAH